MTTPRRIAMWSGPRNLSTTMMRSFGARSDTACIDEPFYAVFLSATGHIHPMNDAVLAAQPGDPSEVIAHLTGPAPNGAPVFYQKHMVHHMVPAIARDWTAQIDTHIMLVRHPARVIASYQRKMETLSLEALGFEWQDALWRDLEAVTGKRPPVIDADEILADPEAVLKRLCYAIDLPWDPAMLSWPPGAREEDGVWAPHWYDKVWASTGFGAAPGPLPVHTGKAAKIEKEALVFYQRLLKGHV